MGRAGAAILAAVVIALQTAVGADTSFSFVVMGDTRSSNADDPVGCYTPVICPMAEDIAKLSPAPKAVVMVGDLVVGDLKGNRKATIPNLRGMLKNFKDAMAPLDKAQIPLYVIRGNHETYTGLWYKDKDGNPKNNDTTDWMCVFGDNLPPNGPTPPKYPVSERGMTYYFTIDNSLFICLDNYMQSESIKNQTKPQVNQAWLNDTLTAFKGQYTNLFVFSHAPVRQVNIASVMSWNPSERNTFVKSIINAGCTTYFCGHDHFYALAKLVSVKNVWPDNTAIYQDLIGCSGASGTPDTPDTWNGKYEDKTCPDDAKNIKTATAQNYNTCFGYAIVKVTGSTVVQTFRIFDEKTKAFSEQSGSAFTLSTITP